MAARADDQKVRRGSRGRMPTMRDVAEHLGVSRQLVSLVMRDAAGPSPESRERILAAARELGYRPNASARLLRQDRTGLLGVVFAMRNPFQVRVVERLLVRAAEQGLRVVLGPVTAERSTDAAVAALMEERVEALVAFNPDPSSKTLAEARELVPLVWLGEWARSPETDNVHVDEAEGLRLAIEHLVGLGHRDIVYVGGHQGIVGEDRADAYRAAMAGAGLSSRIKVQTGDFSEEGGAGAARRILARKKHPTAVVCGGDQVAAGVLAVFAQSGIGVPEEISVIGFDDSYLASLSYHRLTTVRQDAEATVEAVLSTVLERLESDEAEESSVFVPRVIATPTELVLRESTGPVRAN